MVWPFGRCLKRFKWDIGWMDAEAFPRYSIPLEPSNSFEGSGPSPTPPPGGSSLEVETSAAFVTLCIFLHLCAPGGNKDMFVTIAVSPGDETQEAEATHDLFGVAAATVLEVEEGRRR